MTQDHMQYVASEIIVGHPSHRSLLIFTFFRCWLRILFLNCSSAFLHHFGHASSHELLLSLPHPHIRLDRCNLRPLQLFFDHINFLGKIWISCELSLHMRQHLKLHSFLLLRIWHLHLWHVLHHMCLHLSRHSLLNLQLINLFFFAFIKNLLSELHLQFKHLYHLILLSCQYLSDCGSHSVPGKVRNQIEICFIPVYIVSFSRLNVRKS